MFCISDAPTFLLETNVSQSISFSISLRKIFFFILSLLLFHQSPLIRDGYLKGPSALLSHSCPVFTWFQSFSWRISENTIHLATWTSWELHQKEVCTCFHGHIKCWGNILSFDMCDVSFHLSDISFYMSDISFYMSDNVIWRHGKAQKKSVPFFVVKASRFPHLTCSIHSARTQNLTINY